MVLMLQKKLLRKRKIGWLREDVKGTLGEVIRMMRVSLGTHTDLITQERTSPVQFSIETMRLVASIDDLTRAE